MTKIPFLSLNETYTELKNEIDESITNVLNSGIYIHGKFVTEFEENWKTYCNADFSVGCGNGLDALYISLLALGIGSGDEVIVPSFTFIATWLAVSRTGAKIIPIEPDINTYNIDHTKIESMISEKTKAIIAVHLYGSSCDLDSIGQICKKNGIFLLEDAAQAHGTLYKGSKIGSFGDVVCWSFYPGKNLGAFGDAGAITTNNGDIAEKFRMISNYGSTIKYHHEIQGVNSRLDSMQAAVLNVKLKYLDSWIKTRRELANSYNAAFKNLSDIVCPLEPQYSLSAWHLYVIRTENRDKLQNKLKSKGIDTLVHYPIPPYAQKSYDKFLRKNPVDFQLTDLLSSTVLSLPFGPHLKNDSQLRVINTILDFYQH